MSAAIFSFLVSLCIVLFVFFRVGFFSFGWLFFCVCVFLELDRNCEFVDFISALQDFLSYTSVPRVVLVFRRLATRQRISRLVGDLSTYVPASLFCYLLAGWSNGRSDCLSSCAFRSLQEFPLRMLHVVGNLILRAHDNTLGGAGEDYLLRILFLVGGGEGGVCRIKLLRHW